MADQGETVTRPTVLVVDDERLVRWSIVAELEQRGYEVCEAESGSEARREAARQPALVVLDDGLPDADGMELLRELRAERPGAPVVFLVSPGNEARGTDALAQGAFHFVLKPFEPREIGDAVDEACNRITDPPEGHPKLDGQSKAAEMLLGQSEQMRRIRQLLARIAAGPARGILVSGEGGTGRHLTARAIHAMSDRADGPMRYHSAEESVPSMKDVLESCHDGTVVLDHLAGAPAEVQAGLRQHLHGGAGARMVVIGEPNIPLQMASGELDEELLKDLRALSVELPPLRHRREDIPLLARHFVQLLAPVVGSPAREVSEGAAERLRGHDWPGNVRELRDRIERALVFCDGEVLDERALGSLNGVSHAELSFTLPPKGLDLKELERSLVVQALSRTKGNRTRAAELLHMTRDQMRYRVAKFGLD